MNQLGLKAFSARTLWWGALFVALLAGAAWAGLPAAWAQGTVSAPIINGFELLDERTGWVWRGADLDWTEDGGGNWRRITPAGENEGEARLQAVYFRDTRTGWALLGGAPSAQGESAFLAATADAGASWRVHPLPAALAQDLAGAKAVHLVALRAAEGFIAADLAQSSNFSRGALWYTADGGASWQERSLPLGEAPQFVHANMGWVAGGPAGDALWRTEDGGITWAAEAVPFTAAAGERVQVYTPLFTADGEDAVLPLLLRGEAGKAAAWAGLPGGFREATGKLPGSLPEARTEARTALLAATGKPILPPTGPLPFFANTEVGGGLRLVEVKMAGAQTG